MYIYAHIHTHIYLTIHLVLRRKKPINLISSASVARFSSRLNFTDIPSISNFLIIADGQINSYQGLKNNNK